MNIAVVGVRSNIHTINISIIGKGNGAVNQNVTDFDLRRQDCLYTVVYSSQ